MCRIAGPSARAAGQGDDRAQDDHGLKPSGAEHPIHETRFAVSHRVVGGISKALVAGVSAFLAKFRAMSKHGSISIAKSERQ
jgi:hypothetical protein